MKLNLSQHGATLTEFIAIGPIVFILGMTGIQYSLMYNAKSNLTYASYEAARAGAIENADPEAIKTGLLKGFLPYLSANSGLNSEDVDSIALLQQVATEETSFMKVEIINPNEKAFDDFNNTTLQKVLGTDRKVIPNKQTDINNLKSKTGGSSGFTIEEANVLKLRITYGYEPNIPVVGNMFAQAYDLISGNQDPFDTLLFAVNRIPVVVDVSYQMLSPAVQNGLKVASNNPGQSDNSTKGDYKIPELSEINLPDIYNDKTNEEIVNDILTNGRPEQVSNYDWVKILIAVGIIAIGADQISNSLNNVDSSGNLMPDKNLSDLFGSDTVGQYCTP